MTENNREEILKDIREGYIDAWDNLTIDELFETIEKEHNEIQQYRTIGTVEEFKDLKEKAEPKKPKEISWGATNCSICGQEFGFNSHFNHCSNCGQKLDWSE